jgi:hypothetical protein
VGENFRCAGLRSSHAILITIAQALTADNVALRFSLFLPVEPEYPGNASASASSSRRVIPDLTYHILGTYPCTQVEVLFNHVTQEPRYFHVYNHDRNYPSKAFCHSFMRYSYAEAILLEFITRPSALMHGVLYLSHAPNQNESSGLEAWSLVLTINTLTSQHLCTSTSTSASSSIPELDNENRRIR